MTFDDDLSRDMLRMTVSLDPMARLSSDIRKEMYVNICVKHCNASSNWPLSERKENPPVNVKRWGRPRLSPVSSTPTSQSGSLQESKSECPKEDQLRQLSYEFENRVDKCVTLEVNKYTNNEWQHMNLTYQSKDGGSSGGSLNMSSVNNGAGGWNRMYSHGGNAMCPQGSNGIYSQQGNGMCLQPGNGMCPQPGNGMCPQPGNGMCLQPGNGMCPQPANVTCAPMFVGAVMQNQTHGQPCVPTYG